MRRVGGGGETDRPVIQPCKWPRNNSNNNESEVKMSTLVVYLLVGSFLVVHRFRSFEFISLSQYISLSVAMCICSTFAVRLPLSLSLIAHNLFAHFSSVPLSENFHSAFKNIFLSFRTSLPVFTSFVVVYLHILRHEFEYSICFFCIHYCHHSLPQIHVRNHVKPTFADLLFE